MAMLEITIIGHDNHCPFMRKEWDVLREKKVVYEPNAAAIYLAMVGLLPIADGRYGACRYGI